MPGCSFTCGGLAWSADHYTMSRPNGHARWPAGAVLHYGIYDESALPRLSAKIVNRLPAGTVAPTYEIWDVHLCKMHRSTRAFCFGWILA